jgi:hypothetical protein
MKRWTYLLATGLALVLVLAACLPIPNVRVPLQLPPVKDYLSPWAVKTQYVELPGYLEPHTPAKYNRALYLRFYAALEPTHTILVLVPGLFGSATDFDLLARQLVAATPGLEVWATERRSNLLEDRSAMTASLERHDPMLAYDYYVKNYGKPGGFQPLSPDEVRFEAYWGLKVALEDVHRVVLEAHAHAPQVILGGHSLGGSIVGFYAAYNFGSAAHPDPGYRHIDGLVLLDGVLGRSGGFAHKGPGYRLGPFQVLPSTRALEAGRASPYFNTVFGPKYSVRSDVQALLARFNPDGLSPGGFVDYPATNRAVLGISNGTRYLAIPIFGITMGHAIHATFAGNFLAFLLGGTEGASSQSVTGVAKGFDRVDWERGDAPVDMSNLVRGWVTEDADSSEWYFPTRLLLDVAKLDVSLKDTPGFVPNSKVPTPTLAVGAGHGLVQKLEGFASYMNVRPGSPFSTYILPDFTHLDLTYAEKNPLVPLIQAWLRQLR